MSRLLNSVSVCQPQKLTQRYAPLPNVFLSSSHKAEGLLKVQRPSGAKASDLR